MDNFTHSLIGAAVGHVIGRKSEEPKRKALLWASVLGNNFPDLDAVYTRITPPPIGYLLHHRGHTHTLLLSLPQAGLIFLLIRLFFPKAGWSIFLTALLGNWLHIFADSWNSYGVHPFFPFDNRWFYGDAVFILEPMLWALLGTTCALAAKNRWWRWIIPIFPLSMPFLMKWREMISWPSVCLALGMMAFIALISQKVTRANLCAIALTLAFSTVGCLKVFSTQAGSLIREKLTQDFPKEKNWDVILSAQPSNPWRWQFAAIQTDPQIYLVRRGEISLSPLEIILKDEHPLPLQEFKTRARDDCRLNAWLRFSRAPFWDEHRAIDLRFTRNGRNGFTELSLAPPIECPKWIPPWVHPRADILNSLN